jgi:hypothetical protein
MKEWRLDIAGVKSLDLTHFVDPSQPLQIMAMRRDKPREGEKENCTFLWELDVYHARALGLLGDEWMGPNGEKQQAKREEEERQGGRGRRGTDGEKGGERARNGFASLFRRNRPGKMEGASEEGEKREASSTAPVG